MTHIDEGNVKRSAHTARTEGTRKERSDATNHTPGPWTVNDYAREPYNKLVIVADGPISIAVLLADPIDKTKSPAQQRANAHLIAAAPELLSALEYVVQWHRDHDSGEGELFGLDYVTTCIGAIRKAKGEQ